MLEYRHAISANICLFGLDIAPGIRRDARREMRAFERLAAPSPDRLIKTKVAYEMGDAYEDMTLREYARESAERLSDPGYGKPGQTERACRERYRSRFRAIAKAR